MKYISSDIKRASYYFALEKYLLEETDGEYFLFWNTVPTLMTGRYQNVYAEINLSYAKEHNIAIIRRQTGGGTIFTDENTWQFSYITRNSGKSIDFDIFTKPILEALNFLGVPAELRGRNDLVANGKKISGNAQLSSKYGKIHHGSLLFGTYFDMLENALTPPKEKLESKGIKSVRQRVCNISELINPKITNIEFKDKMLALLTKGMEKTALTSEQEKKVLSIEKSLFVPWEWNYGKNPEFNIVKENRFNGGKLAVSISVISGKINEIVFFGDFFADEKLFDLKKSLIDCPYRMDDIKEVFAGFPENIIFGITKAEILSCII